MSNEPVAVSLHPTMSQPKPDVNFLAVNCCARGMAEEVIDREISFDFQMGLRKFDFEIAAAVEAFLPRSSQASLVDLQSISNIKDDGIIRVSRQNRWDVAILNGLSKKIHGLKNLILVKSNSVWRRRWCVGLLFHKVLRLRIL